VAAEKSLKSVVENSRTVCAVLMMGVTL